VKETADRNRRWRRHIPAALLLLAITALLFALARPVAVLPVVKGERTVILTIDTSASMTRTDIKPTRLEAAQTAARDFAMRQDPTLLIGVVAFSRSASLVQSPTTDRNAIVRAINGLQEESSTAIGSAIIASLNAIQNESQAPGTMNALSLFAQPTPQAAQSASSKTEYPAAIILLTDGRNTTGPEPLDAAAAAAQLGVPVFTVGIGTVSSSNASTEDGLDEPTLTKIADMTHGRYFHAIDENALAAIYQNLHLQFNIRTEKLEMAPGLAGVALVLVLLGTILSQRWTSQIP
jgi:Ca-activated chloride channel family protein